MLNFLLFQPDGRTVVLHGGNCTGSYIHHAACHCCRLMFVAFCSELLSCHVRRINVEQYLSVNTVLSISSSQAHPALRPQYASNELDCTKRLWLLGGVKRLQS